MIDSTGSDSPQGSPTHSPRGSKLKIIDEDPSKIWDDLPKHLKIKKRTAYIRRHSDLKVSSTFRKFNLLLWKNFIVGKRRWKTSLFQFTAPAFLITVLVISISHRQNETYRKAEFEAFNVDERPPHAFFNNYRANNSHHQHDRPCNVIYFKPKNNATEGFRQHLENGFKEKGDLLFKFFDGKRSLDIIPTDLCALIQFNIPDWENGKIADDFPTNISYEIRFPPVHDSGQARSSLISIGREWDTAFRYPTYLPTGGPREPKEQAGGRPGYYNHGFLYIQHLIAEELMEIIYLRETKAIDPNFNFTIESARFDEMKNKIRVRLRRFPFPEHKNEDAIAIMHDTLPVILVCGFGISAIIMVYLSVREKEMGIRVLLHMYGITNTFHRYAWILHNFIFQSFSALLITAILSTNWSGTGSGLFEGGVIFFVLLVCYVFNLICTITLIVCFFSRSGTACISTCFIWTVTYVPYIYVKSHYNILTFWERVGCCFCLNTAISIGCHIISQNEGLEGGMTWTELFGHDLKEFSLGYVMITMIVASLLELLVAEYISKLFPDKGMQKMPWNYLFKSWYWNGQLPPDEVHPPQSKTQEKSFEENHPEYFEDDSQTKRRKELAIENVSKYYGKLRALHKVNLLCYQGHVTVLLGDHGGGKSTLLKMLNGTMTPTSGTIFLSRKEMYKNQNLGRAFVGYCPAEDLLFPDLTVDETLQFFTDLKGLTNRIEAYEEVERFLKITMLIDFRDTRVCELTNSSQRMLMVATAFCGGSRVVLLDSPCTNLSAAQQRVLWDFTGQEKKHRTILVSMDEVHEVDSVVDKIVLLHYGQVTTRGSPDFLKTKFGGGYHLDVVTTESCNVKALEFMITRRINGSRLFTTEGNLLNFYLPYSETPSFPGLLEEFENSPKTYGIESFKLRFVTLEELHLRLKTQSTSFDETTNIEAEAIKRDASQNPLRSEAFTPLTGFPQHFREFKLMLGKNIKYTLRHRLYFFLTTFATLALLTGTHFLTRVLELKADALPHFLNYSDYSKPCILSDIYKATNEGRYMRASVNFLLSKSRGIKQKPVNFHEDIYTEVLREYKEVDDDEDVPYLGVEIAPVEDKCDDKECVKVGLTGYFNNQPLHGPGVAVSLMDDILMDYVENYIQRRHPTYVKKHYQFNVSNHPLNYQPADIITYSQLLVSPGYIFGVFCSFSYSFLISSFLTMHITEQDFRHMQLIFGANKIIFWASNYIVNLLHFTTVVLLHVLVVWLAGIPGFPSNWKQYDALGTIFVFLMFYGMTSVCIVGTFASFHWKNSGNGFSKLTLFNIITGPLIMLVMIPLQHEKLGLSTTGYTILHNLFMVFPSYAIGVGMFHIVADEIHRVECHKYDKFQGGKNCRNSVLITPFNEFSHDGSTLQSCCFNSRNEAFSFVAYGVGRNVFMMMLVAIGCIGQKIFSHSKKQRKMELNRLQKNSRKWDPVIFNEHEIRDFDVLAETAKIYKGEDHEDLTFKNLTLETPLYVKIDNMCLEVMKGECFALLGSIGAGKTILMKTLSGYPGHLPTYGDVILHGKSMIHDYDKYTAAISYCPDRNPFMEELTGYEVLQLIGVIRKIPNDDLEKHISHYASNLGMLTELENSIKGYNHIVVKKLCVAAALLGKAEVLFLDDPTHHLLGKAKQFVYTKVKQRMEEGCIVLWTSLGIDQVESICSRLSILVNGHLRCIGRLDHLKELYEEGFTVIVRFILDKDMIYFTSKKNIRMENEIRENEIDEETGLPQSTTKLEQRKNNLKDVLHEDVEKALSELAPWEQDLCPFVAYFERAFPNSVLVDKQPGFIHYHVHQDKSTWSTLFRKMEEAKAVAEVDSYYIARTNLDQVFFNYTRGQVSFNT